MDINDVLKDFLDEVIVIFDEETRENKSVLDLSYIKSVKGFEYTEFTDSCYGPGYCFTNSNGHKCFLCFYGKERTILIRIDIDDISSYYRPGTIESLYRCLDGLDIIADELSKLKSDLIKQKNDLIKQKKQDEIVKNSIDVWLKILLSNQPYSYYTTKRENKTTLSVRLKNRTQLDIPIYYKSFQKIKPEILNLIQQIDKIDRETKIRMLISNTVDNKQWITPNSK